jgi:hypothetical protein
MQRLVNKGSDAIPNMACLIGLVVIGAAVTGSSAPLGNAQAPQGGTFYYNISTEPPTLNPITSTDVSASRVQGYVMDSLMERDEETYEWQPSLAQKAETSADGRTFTFTIRRGAKFHDGKEITATGVRRGGQSVRGEYAPHRVQALPGERVDPVTDALAVYAVRVDLDAGRPGLLRVRITAAAAELGGAV